MKNYKEKVLNLGYSDIARLNVVGVHDIAFLDFRCDGDYSAYITENYKESEIPTHYNKVLEIKGPWIVIYDDEAKVFDFHNYDIEKFEIYRAGDFGCLINKVYKKQEDEEVKLAYICSPFNGEIERNIKYAITATKKVILDRYTPIVPHLYLTRVLNDKNDKEREIGLKIGFNLLKKCDTVFVFEDYGISKGMEREIEIAKELGKEIIRTSLFIDEADLCEEVKYIWEK